MKRWVYISEQQHWLLVGKEHHLFSIGIEQDIMVRDGQDVCKAVFIQKSAALKSATKAISEFLNRQIESGSGGKDAAKSLTQNGNEV